MRSVRCSRRRRATRAMTVRPSFLCLSSHAHSFSLPQSLTSPPSSMLAPTSRPASSTQSATESPSSRTTSYSRHARRPTLRRRRRSLPPLLSNTFRKVRFPFLPSLPSYLRSLLFFYYLDAFRRIRPETTLTLHFSRRPGLLRSHLRLPNSSRDRSRRRRGRASASGGRGD